MKTVEEIEEKYNYLNQEDNRGDMFGYQREIMSDFIPSCYKSEVDCPPLTRMAVEEKMLDYLSFAFDKAIDHRGISAQRSISKMGAWLWILDEEELLVFIRDHNNFINYGMPILKKIAQKFDRSIPDEAKNWEDGKPCEPGCDIGCGVATFHV